jgi:hypothetical protein
MYCLCVNVYCTTATGCQPNCSWQIYHIITYHMVNCHRYMADYIYLYIYIYIYIYIYVHPRTGHEGPEGEERYSSTLSLTSALDGVGGQRYAPPTLSPGKTRYPLYRRVGGLQGRSGQVRKISPPKGFDPRTVQPVASRYTDWAIPAHSQYTFPVIIILPPNSKSGAPPLVGRSWRYI